MFYSTYWTSELMEAIRKVELTKSAGSMFLTSECGISPLAMLPRTVKEIALIKREEELYKKTTGTLTYAEGKKAEKTPPPPNKVGRQVCDANHIRTISLDALGGEQYPPRGSQ